METLIRDIRYAARGLLKQPVFAAIVLLTLGLGIGASTAIFSVVNSVLLRKLPYRQPDRIVAIQELSEKGTRVQVTSANFLDWRAQNTVFEHLAAIRVTTSNLALADYAERIDIAQTSANFFEVFGVTPTYGRFFIPTDEQAGHGLPNVKSVGIVNYLPLSGSNNRRNVTVEGAPENPTNVEFRLCSSDYFKVLGISPVAGRLFDDGDRQDTLYVAVVNQTFVKVFLDNQNPLGKRIRMGGGLQSPFRWLSVVGVIKDIKHKGPDADSAPEMYIPYLQPPLADWNVDSMFVAVRTEGEPIGAISAVSRAVREVDKELPIYSVQTMEQLLSKNIAPRRFNMQLISLFSALALLLASIGIYGVMSFSVAQRTKELGIRMALGARAGNILSLILREGIVLALLGGAIGVVAALLLAQLMTKLLFGIAPRDITSFAAAAFALFVVAFLACYLPARRATKVDPLVALRYE